MSFKPNQCPASKLTRFWRQLLVATQLPREPAPLCEVFSSFHNTLPDDGLYFSEQICGSTQDRLPKRPQIPEAPSRNTDAIQGIFFFNPSHEYLK